MSDRILTLLGNLCVDTTFRSDFFADPVGAARSVYADLSGEDEQAVAGLIGNREAFDKNGLKEGFDAIEALLNCPRWPCPPPMHRRRPQP